jgi:hypothetical protein
VAQEQRRAAVIVIMGAVLGVVLALVYRWRQDDEPERPVAAFSAREVDLEDATLPPVCFEDTEVTLKAGAAPGVELRQVDYDDADGDGVDDAILLLSCRGPETAGVATPWISVFRVDRERRLQQFGQPLFLDNTVSDVTLDGLEVTYRRDRAEYVSRFEGMRFDSVS